MRKIRRVFPQSHLHPTDLKILLGIFSKRTIMAIRTIMAMIISLNMEKLVDSLKAALEADLYLPSQHFDFLFQREGIWYAAAIRYVRESRRTNLEGQLAIAILQGQTYAKEEPHDPLPLAIVAAPLVTGAMLAELESFVKKFGCFNNQPLAWGVIDGRGLVRIFGSGLEVHRLAKPSSTAHSKHSISSNLFSDLNQWMLKVLLSHKLPVPLQLKDRDGHVLPTIQSAVELARIAKVSVPHAARFLNQLRQEGFLERGEAGQWQDLETLFARWQAAYQIKRPLEIRTRWLLPKSDLKAHLEERLSKSWRQDQSVCLGLFAASARWDFPFVQAVSPHILVKCYSPDLLRSLQLTIAEPGEAVDIFLREPIYSESVFRGVQLHDGIPIADILQCWLDLSGHPARGEEMIEMLFQQVIQPFFLESHE
jgi:hypothetical protein